MTLNVWPMTYYVSKVKRGEKVSSNVKLIKGYDSDVLDKNPTPES